MAEREEIGCFRGPGFVGVKTTGEKERIFDEVVVEMVVD
jgi:hypothetical protein